MGKRLWGAPDKENDNNDDTAINFHINDLLYLIEDSQHSSYPIAVFDLNKQEVVGRFTIYHPGLSYSSMMLPVPYEDRIILRRSYSRISCLTFHQPKEGDMAWAAEFTEGIQVVAPEENAVFNVELSQSAPAINKVQFLVDGKLHTTDTTPPFVFEAGFPQAGVHQVQGIAIAEDGSKAQTSERLVSVVDWEVRLLPNNVTMEVGEQRRFIPVAFNPRNGHQLPQRFQALQMGQFLDTAYSTPFAKITQEHHEKWHARAALSVSSGTIVTSNESEGKNPYQTWGSFTPSEPGKHTVTVKYTHAGVTKEAQVSVLVRDPNEKLEQSVRSLAPLRTYKVGGGSLRQMIAAMDSNLNPAEVNWKVTDGPAKETGKGARMEVTGPGWITLQAQHPGNDRYKPSEPVIQRVLAIPQNDEQTALNMSFEPLADATTSDGPFTLQAASPSSEPVRISVISGPAFIQENQLFLTGKIGTVTLIAEHPGDLTYLPARPIIREFKVK